MNASKIVSAAVGLAAAALALAAPVASSAATADASRAETTGAFYQGSTVVETYARSWYCDRSVASKAPSGCEQGQRANVPPARTYNTEYAIVPIGFTPADAMTMQCPEGAPCVGHPRTIDMTRVANPLALVMGTTGPALLPSLGDRPLPGHQHFLENLGDGKPQWWNVAIVGCTNPETYRAVVAHRSLAYIEQLLAKGDPGLLLPTPTNLFLNLSVSRPAAGA